MITSPASLQFGDKVAIISPATRVKDEYIDGAEEWLRHQGFVPVVGRYARGPRDGNYASARSNRLEDLMDAILNPEIKAILCARGGYGCCQLLPNFSYGIIRDNAKWLIGFSDVSALHAMMVSSDVMSLHAPMAKHLTLESPDHPATRALFDIITGADRKTYLFDGHPLNVAGVAEGRLIGGNLAVLDGLAATPYDILSLHSLDKAILFIEDISEPLYKIDRILTRLYLSGAMNLLSGLVVGQFTECPPDPKFNDIAELIDNKLHEWAIPSFPVAYNAPIGHVSMNMPIVCGCNARLEVGGDHVSLDMYIR